MLLCQKAHRANTLHHTAKYVQSTEQVLPGPSTCKYSVTNTIAKQYQAQNGSDGADLQHHDGLAEPSLYWARFAMAAFCLALMTREWMVCCQLPRCLLDHQARYPELETWSLDWPSFLP